VEGRMKRPRMKMFDELIENEHYSAIKRTRGMSESVGFQGPSSEL